MSAGAIVVHKPMVGQVLPAVVVEPEILGLGYVYLSLFGRSGGQLVAHEDDLIECSSPNEARLLARQIGGY